VQYDSEDLWNEFVTMKETQHVLKPVVLEVEDMEKIRQALALHVSTEQHEDE
ncbi:hypothetical protein A2U01_0061852, partial [Trifolium medium]|nr:hypothetical protein [Trifolium medium]